MATIEQARSYYEQKDHSRLIATCAELIEADANNLEARTLLCKGLISVMTGDNESTSKSYFDFVVQTCQLAQSAPELLAIEQEFQLTLEQRRVTYAQEYSALALEKADFDDWKAYFNNDVGFVKEKLMTSLAAAQGGLSRFAEEAGLSPAELRKQWEEENGNDYNATDDRNAVLMDTAYRLLEKADAILENNDHCNATVANNLIKTLIRYSTLAQLIFGFVTPDADKGKDQQRLAGLQGQAQAITWKLEAVVHFEGKAISIIVGTEGREKELQTLRSIYDDISALDPNFVPPALPSAIGVNPTPAQSSSGGGCYVATAVYGSYDCPQVWVLRRFRDHTLAESWYGRGFIRTYYAISPTLVKWFGNSQWFQKLWKPRLDKLVANLQAEGVSDQPYSDRIW